MLYCKAHIPPLLYTGGFKQNSLYTIINIIDSESKSEDLLDQTLETSLQHRYISVYLSEVGMPLMESSSVMQYRPSTSSGFTVVQIKSRVICILNAFNVYVPS